MEYNSVLRSPKKEEHQVPDSVFPILLDSSAAHSNDDYFNILDEPCAGVLGSQHDHTKLRHTCYGTGQLNWDFMELEGFSAEVAEDDEGEEDEEEKQMRSKCLVEDDRIIIKTENEGLCWEEEDDEKMTSLKLNLNYQEVLDAWSGRGSLWADDSSLSMASNTNNGFRYMGEVPILEEDRSRRNASVRRYKEKRQSRLFCKKIRYQVRKLNADKRPRLKGRFVKRLQKM